MKTSSGFSTISNRSITEANPARALATLPRAGEDDGVPVPTPDPRALDLLTPASQRLVRTVDALDDADLYVKNAYVDEGTTLKRFQPRAQGRAFQIKKRTSHITVVLSTPAVAEPAAAKDQKASK